MTLATHARPGLLVSVRDANEALAALAGGADLIDIKEPDHGSLGRAEAETMASILASVAGRRPVSAALGELLDRTALPIPAGLAFVKWGLAGYGTDLAWQAELREWHANGAGLVAVAYADWQCARAPSVQAVLRFALERPQGVLLVDTHCKEPARLGAPRPTLLDWLSVAEIVQLCDVCREHCVRVALAGSLGPAELSALAPARPDWFAVRGAACDAGRQGTVTAPRVRALATLLRSLNPPSAD